MDTTHGVADRQQMRLCSRVGCSENAASTLSYQYSQAQVWIDDLSLEVDPHTYDLCARHAARFGAPQGWSVIDRRVQASLLAG